MSDSNDGDLTEAWRCAKRAADLVTLDLRKRMERDEAIPTALAHSYQKIVESFEAIGHEFESILKLESRPGSG